MRDNLALPPGTCGGVREWVVGGFVAEAPIWLPCAILTFIAASVLMTGWPAGLVPNLSYPYSYTGDMLSASWVVQNLIEGNWTFHTDRSGYPFGSDLLDYPMSDSGSLAILRILGWLTGSYWVAVNLYFLLGFPAAFMAAYVVLRIMRVSVALAAAGSLLFALLPYHFQRLEHLFLTWYFVVPVFFLFAWRLYSVNGRRIESALAVRTAFVHAIALVASASFGIYYAVFGTMVLALGGLGGWLRDRSLRIVAATFAAASITIMGTGLNIAPNLVHVVRSGPNNEVAHRGVADSEIYGLKMIQMLLPRADHRIPALRDVTRRYDSVAPLINENVKAALGIVGATGLLLLGGVIYLREAGRAVDERLAFLALIVLGICAVATVGGLSVVFAALISPQIRAWNRASVFVAFAAIAAAMISLEWLLVRFVAVKWLALALATAASLVAVVGVLDQTAPACEACNRAIQVAFERDRDFSDAIEASLPQGAAIYQLPYMPFPEAPPTNHLLNYELATGVINSKQLRWSYGGMKGREGDLFFRALVRTPMATQLDILRRLNFSGIYVDRRGYSDGGRAIEDELRQLTGAGPNLIRSDNQIAFYKLGPGTPALADGLSTAHILQLAGFDAHGPRYAASLESGMDLRKNGLPEFVEDVKGLSWIEPWGRWSDANLRRNVIIRFTDPLPRAFTLMLRGQAFGPNAEQPVRIRIGRETETITLSSNMEDRHVRFDLGDRAEREIEITPPVPVAPRDLFVSHDTRRLGIGLERIWFER